MSRHRHSIGGFLRSVLLLAAFGVAAPASAAFVINPTFSSNITSDPNAATIENTINAAIAQYEAIFTDNITVNITFQEGGGLGSSSTPIIQVPYATVRNTLIADAKTADDTSAVATLPLSAVSPADGSTNMWVTSANARAIGLSAAPATDGTITLNTSIMNLDRATIDPSKFDLQSVAEHEIDEVLGLGSGLNLPTGFPRLSRVEDLFRYSAPSTRSFTIGQVAYFSIDGGVTNLAAFHSLNDGADFGDWDSASVRVQNAFGTAGATPNLDVELVALDVIGYDRVVTSAVPEPSTLADIVLACLAVVLLMRRRSMKHLTAISH